MAIPSRLTRPPVSLESEVAALTAESLAYEYRLGMQRRWLHFYVEPTAAVGKTAPEPLPEPVSAPVEIDAPVMRWVSEWGDLALSNEEEVRAAWELLAYLGRDSSEIVEARGMGDALAVKDYLGLASSMVITGIATPSEVQCSMGLNTSNWEQRYVWDGPGMPALTSVEANPPMPPRQVPMEGTLIYK